MLKQRESSNLNPPFSQLGRRNYFVILFASLILLSLSTEEANAQSPFLKQETTSTNSGLTRLDSLIHGPYVQEVKRQKANELLLQKVISESPVLTFERTAYITIQSIQQTVLQTPPGKDALLDFCLFRKTFDIHRMQHKEFLTQWYVEQGYSVTQAYQLHQAICYKINQPYTDNISLVGNEFYELLSQQATYYGLISQEVLRGHLGVKYGGLIAVPSNADHWTPDPSLFRTEPTPEKLRIGGKTIERIAFDRKTVYEIFLEQGISLRSTMMQDDEEGSSCEHFRTCLEGFSEETLEGILLLKNILQQQECKENIEVIINGGTEKGHAKELYILAGMVKSGYTLTTKDIEAHGLGYTFDLRVSGETGILLQKIFPGKQGIVTHKNEQGVAYVYKYLLHGTGTAKHRHVTCTKKTTRDMLYK